MELNFEDIPGKGYHTIAGSPCIHTCVLISMSDLFKLESTAHHVCALINGFANNQQHKLQPDSRKHDHESDPEINILINLHIFFALKGRNIKAK